MPHKCTLRPSRIALAALLLGGAWMLVLPACTRDDDIRRYDSAAGDAGQKRDPIGELMSKSPGKNSPMAQLPHGSIQGSPSLKYDAPEGWVEEPASGMRKASFHVADGEKKVEITAIDLFSGAAQLLPNVNRWRGQIKLAPITEEELKKTVQAIPTVGVQGQLVEMVGPADAKPREAILAVIAVRDKKVWFFKLKGDAELALREKKKFEQFVKSAKLTGGSADGPATIRPSSPPGPAPFTFQTPEGWKQGAVRGMRKAAFQLENDGQKAEVTVIDLSAAAGAFLPNVNRWREQLALKPTTKEALDKEAQPITVDGNEGRIIMIMGPEAAKPRPAILGVIFLRGNQSWFVKMIGEAALVQSEKDHFQDLVKSMKFK